MKKYLLTGFLIVVATFVLNATNASAQSAPTLTFTGSPTSVSMNGTAYLSWNATPGSTCTAANGTASWPGTKATAGGFSTGMLTATTTFNLSCTNQYGGIYKYVTIVVNGSGGSGGGGSGYSPTISISASPSTVAPGGTSTITWSYTNATTCTGYGGQPGWYATKTPNGGTVTTAPLYNNATYSVTCSNANGTTTKSVTIFVTTPPQNIPSVYVTANPSYISSGNYSTISWSATNNPTSCSGSWTGNIPSTGSQKVYPTSTTIYVVTCNNGAGTGTGQATVTVQPYNPPPAQTPTVNIYANPTTVSYNTSSMLSWNTTNATSCMASNGWSGSKPTFGQNVSTGPLTSDKTFTLTCSNGSQVASDSVTVFVQSNNPPQQQSPIIQSFYANPASIASGNSSTLIWNSMYTTYCTLSGAGVSQNYLNPSGSFQTGALSNTATYTLVCFNSSGQNTSSTTVVSVNTTQTQLPTVNIYANPTFVNQNGGSTSISWNSTNAVSCSASGGNHAWPGNKSLFGSMTAFNLTAPTYTFNITCINSAGQANDSVTVTVKQASQTPLPTVNITANPTSVSSGGSTILSWDSTNATSCNASGGNPSWPGVKNISGNQTVFNLTSPTYIFNITCINGAGQTSDSVTVSVATQQASNPSVNTNNATNVGSSYATLNGNLNVNGNTNVMAWFEWGTNGNYYNQTTKNYFSANANFNYSLGGLSENTTYSYRAVAQGDNGQIVYGNQMTFYTLSNVCTYNCGTNYSQPSVTTYVPSGIGENYATLNGYVDPNGSYTTRWFEWGTNTGSLYNTTAKIAQGTSAGNFSQQITGLAQNTTYSYRAVAQNSAGIVYGNIQTFVTIGNTIYNPCLYGNCNSNSTVSTIPATNIDYNSARINGFAIINGNTTTNGYFEWGTSSFSLPNKTAPSYIGNQSTAPFHASLFGLASNTTYYFRAVISNQNGTFYGDTLSFRTGTIPRTTTNTNTIIYRDRIVTTNNTNTNLTTGISKPSLVYLSISKNGVINNGINGTINIDGSTGTVQRGQIVDFTAYYKNVSNEQLREVALMISLPKEATYISTSRGYLSENGNTIVVDIGNLFPQEEGSVTVRARISSTVETGKIIVVSGNIPYTYTLISANGVPTVTQEEVFAYGNYTVEGSEINLQGTALFGAGFFPDTFIEWLLLLLIILIILWIARMIYDRTTTPKSTTVVNHYGNPPPPPSHHL